MLVELSVGLTGEGRTRSIPVEEDVEFDREVGRRCDGVVGVRSPLRCEEKLNRPSAVEEEYKGSSEES